MLRLPRVHQVRRTARKENSSSDVATAIVAAFVAAASIAASATITSAAAATAAIPEAPSRSAGPIEWTSRKLSQSHEHLEQ